MLSRDSYPIDAWGKDINFDDSTCEDCGRSTVGRFGLQPFALCDSCQSDENRILADPNTTWEPIDSANWGVTCVYCGAGKRQDEICPECKRPHRA